MRRLPPTAALEAFLATARSGTLKLASEELNLSVSALSRRIKSLEDYIGRPLFDRLHHEFRMTGAGERLLQGIEPSLKQLGTVFEELREEQKYQVNIGVPASFATAWLLPRLHSFRASHAEVELRIDSSGSPMEKLGKSLDAIIFFANQDEDEYDIDLHILRPQRAFAVAAPGLIDLSAGLASALQEQPLLLHNDLPEILPSWLKEIGYDQLPETKLDYYDDGPLILSAAQNRLGIALILEDMINFYPQTSDLVRPFGESAPTPYSYALAVKSASGNNRALCWFCDWLLEETEKDARARMNTAKAA